MLAPLKRFIEEIRIYNKRNWYLIYKLFQYCLWGLFIISNDFINLNFELNKILTDHATKELLQRGTDLPDWFVEGLRVQKTETAASVVKVPHN